MGRAEACICCQEIEQVKNKLNETVTSGECDEDPTASRVPSSVYK